MLTFLQESYQIQFKGVPFTNLQEDQAQGVYNRFHSVKQPLFNSTKMSSTTLWNMITQFFAPEPEPERAPKRMRLNEEGRSLPIMVRIDCSMHFVYSCIIIFIVYYQRRKVLRHIQCLFSIR